MAKAKQTTKPKPLKTKGRPKGTAKKPKTCKAKGKPKVTSPKLKKEKKSPKPKPVKKERSTALAKPRTVRAKAGNVTMPLLEAGYIGMGSRLHWSEQIAKAGCRLCVTVDEDASPWFAQLVGWKSRVFVTPPCGFTPETLFEAIEATYGGAGLPPLIDTLELDHSREGWAALTMTGFGGPGWGYHY